MPVLDKLFIKLGYEYDEKKMKTFNEKLAKTGRIFKKVVLAVFSMVSAIAILAIKIGKMNLGQSQLAKKLGISRKELEGFIRVSQGLTGTGDAAERLLGFFASMKDKLKAGIPPAGEFFRVMNMLGLSLEDIENLSPTGLLFKYSQGFRKLDKDGRSLVRGLTDMDAATQTFLLGLNRADFNKALPQKSATEASLRIQKAWVGIKSSLVDAMTVLNRSFLPMIAKVAELTEVVAGWFESWAVSLDKAIDRLIKFKNLLFPSVELRKDGEPAAPKLLDRFTLPPPGFLNPPHFDLRKGLIDRGQPSDSSGEPVRGGDMNFEINVSSADGSQQGLAETIVRTIQLEIGRVSAGVDSRVLA